MVESRQQQSESRDRVLHAAYELFLRNGMTAVSMQQIADEAGITKATLYHHFRHKNDLFMETVRLAMAINEQTLRSQLGDTTDLRVMVRQLLAYMVGSERADLQRLVSDLKLHIPFAEQAKLWNQFHQPWHMLRSSVEMFLPCPGEEDVIFYSRYIYGAAAGLSQLNRFQCDRVVATDEDLERMTDTLLNGIRPR